MKGIKKFFMGFLKDEKGLGTVEMVILIAVLVAVALIFSKSIKEFVKTQIANVTGKANEGTNDILDN